jgi:hypothetical protein
MINKERDFYSYPVEIPFVASGGEKPGLLVEGLSVIASFINRNLPPLAQRFRLGCQPYVYSLWNCLCFPIKPQLLNDLIPAQA